MSARFGSPASTTGGGAEGCALLVVAGGDVVVVVGGADVVVVVGGAAVVVVVVVGACVAVVVSGAAVGFGLGAKDPITASRTNTAKTDPAVIHGHRLRRFLGVG